MKLITSKQNFGDPHQTRLYIGLNETWTAANMVLCQGVYFYKISGEHYYKPFMDWNEL